MIEGCIDGWVTQTLTETGAMGALYLIALVFIIVFKIYKKRWKAKKHE